jgi:hypothetical protein
MKFILKLTVTFLFVTSISYFVMILHSWHKVEYSTGNIADFKTLLKTNKKMGIIHFLTPACGCSSEVLDHLIKRSPLDSETIKEMIVILDDYNSYYSMKLEQKGYKVFNFSSRSENKVVKSIRGVPLLVVFDKNKISRYVGGYSEALISPMTTIDISPLIAKIKNSKSNIKEYPIKGCAVSKKYQIILDPLGIKYAKS